MYSAMGYSLKCGDLCGAQPVPMAQSQELRRYKGLCDTRSGVITDMLTEKDEKQLPTAGYTCLPHFTLLKPLTDM